MTLNTVRCPVKLHNKICFTNKYRVTYRLYNHTIPFIILLFCIVLSSLLHALFVNKLFLTRCLTVMLGLWSP